MDAVIQAETPGRLPPARRLRLMMAARAETDRVVEAYGCEAERVRGWLAVFHADLEKVLVE